ncbi:hypothetical protein Cgig2_006422 [Carnegiea gigantea]|uniref:Aminotransferase-like plant mobile domain-containing protein n=1 Tax=Carnegiea gigantea TaxID=171969 RepID=A0A9Q1GML0_9CARY|nr:hypothetical protein Cgig2_006422 [Carnegiea gigantea]
MSNVTREGELVAFITFWLSHFVQPHGRDVIRPETFVMAALLAKGHRLSLAPIVLGYIYHGLGQAMSHLGHLGEAGATLPIHYVIGWLVELFPRLYSYHPDRKCPKEYPILIRYVGDTHASLSLSQARHIFRDQQFVYLRVNTFLEDSQTGRDLIDMGMSNDNFRYLLFIRSLVLLSILKGVEVIIDIISNHDFARKLLASRARVFQSLSALRSMIDIYDLSAIEICWLSSKLKKYFA